MTAPSIDQAWTPSGKVIRSEEFEVWRDARQLLGKVEEHTETARQDAYRQGYEAGQAEGRQAILRVLIDTQARASSYLDQMDREVAALVITLVERIIGKTPKHERTLLAARQALTRMRKHKHVRVQVPPADVERFRSGLADVPAPGGFSDWLSVEADPHLQEGHCVIATEIGYVRADPETQLENLRETVFESLRARQDGA